MIFKKWYKLSYEHMLNDYIHIIYDKLHPCHNRKKILFTFYKRAYSYENKSFKSLLFSYNSYECRNFTSYNYDMIQKNRKLKISTNIDNNATKYHKLINRKLSSLKNIIQVQINLFIHDISDVDDFYDFLCKKRKSNLFSKIKEYEPFYSKTKDYYFYDCYRLYKNILLSIMHIIKLLHCVEIHNSINHLLKNMDIQNTGGGYRIESIQEIIQDHSNSLSDDIDIIADISNNLYIESTLIKEYEDDLYILTIRTKNTMDKKYCMCVS